VGFSPGVGAARLELVLVVVQLVEAERQLFGNEHEGCPSTSVTDERSAVSGILVAHPQSRSSGVSR
jgi:hypothetical protein